MSGLVEFILARVGEDEAVARAALKPAGWNHFGDTAAESLLGLAESEGAEEVALQFFSRHDPARVLAECEAKRRLLDWCAPVTGSERVPTGRPGVYDMREVRYVNEDGEDVCRYLALPYADHPEFREEWR